MLVNLKKILAYAEKNNTAIGMFNATGLDSLQAIIKAAEYLNQPVIIAHAEVHNVYNDIELLASLLISAAKNAKVPVCVHLDHGVSFEMLKKAIDLGFTSVMVDASALPFEENIEFTKKIVALAHQKNVSVEAELGRLITKENGDIEDGVIDPKDFYTDPLEAKEFVERTNIDALAIAFGTAHGFYKAKPQLDFSVIERVKNACNIPLVMHGGSGVSKEDTQKAIRCGIRKVNYYSYMSKAGYEAAEKVIKSGLTSYLHDIEYQAMLAMKENVIEAIKMFSLES